MKRVATTRRYIIATGGVLFLFLTFLQAMSATGHCTDAETVMPSFGEGKTNVRLYTDYFCPPCRQMEPGIEPVLGELVRDKIITLTFVDTPFYRYSSLYARYFLYAVNEKKDLEHALYVRRSLIEAAKKGLDSAQKLEVFLKEKKIALKPFDPKPVFDSLSRYLKEDGIDATPSCVIESKGKANKYSGAGNITDALTALKPKPSMN